MAKPYHIIATPDENGYIITIPENPDVCVRCSEPSQIVPTAVAAKEKQETIQTQETDD